MHHDSEYIYKFLLGDNILKESLLNKVYLYLFYFTFEKVIYLLIIYIYNSRVS